jgi:hypothetical protein
MKKRVPLTLAFIMGILMMIRYYVPRLEPVESYARQFMIVMGSTAGLLGILSFVFHHATKIQRKHPQYVFSWVAIVAFCTMVLVGFLGAQVGSWFNMENPQSGFAYGTPAFNLFFYVYAPMDATMFALLAFYISSASFRAFRARNLEATLLLGAAVLVMIGRVPIGEAILINDTAIMAKTSEWILDFPNLAAKRAIQIGVALGIASTALKLILGIERAYLGRD